MQAKDRNRRRCVLAAAVAVTLIWSAGCGTLGGDGAGMATAAEEGAGEGSLRPSDPGTQEASRMEGQRSAEEKTDEVPVSQNQGSMAEKESGLLIFDHPEMVGEELTERCEDYASLVESYVESDSFGPGDSRRAEELAELLSGHYEVAGRGDEEGRAYYVAARRADAPVYDDFQCLSVGYVSGPDTPGEVCQIGYDRTDGRERILYQLPDYGLTVLADMKTPEALDCFCLVPSDTFGGKAFGKAFETGGRMELDFLRDHPGLSFFYEDRSYISCYYQDEDTLEFYSEPYLCHILLGGDEVQKLQGLLDQGQKKQVFDRESQAVQWLRQQEPSVRSTGADLKLGDSYYRIFGSKDCGGYIMAYGAESVSLEMCGPAYTYVMDRIRQVMGRDYGTFDDAWFDTPLRKASLEFPRLEKGEVGDHEFVSGTQTVTEPGKLKSLGALLGNAIQGHEAVSACPYKGVLDIEREDGETLRMFVAVDSCDSITYEGRIGFEYGRQEDLAKIFDEVMR